VGGCVALGTGVGAGIGRCDGAGTGGTDG